MTLALSGCAAMPPRSLTMPKMSLAALPFVDPADPGEFQNIGYAQWSDAEPPYLFYYGDEIEVSLPGAPLYSKTVTVQPDGRISLPLVGQIMANGRSIREVEDAITKAYSSELIRPKAYVTAKAAPLQVFVGGEVGQPKEYSIIGDRNALEAVIMAGGFKTSADVRRVVIIRRTGEQTAAARYANLDPKVNTAGHADYVPLRRGDIIYVPRSGVAKVGLFMQQYLRDALPISFSYAINGSTNFNN